MTDGYLQELLASKVKQPLSWVRKTLDKVNRLRPWSNGADTVGDSGNHVDREIPEGLHFTQTRVLPVSRETFRRNRLVAMDEANSVADQFKLMRTHLFNRTRRDRLNVIQITGFSKGEGKSLVAVNLAISIARDSRQTTLLVDADFRNPSIHTLFGLGPDTPGLKQYFLDSVPLEDLLVSPGIDKLSVLPAGGRIPRSTELIGSPAMEGLVKELKERYADRYVIFDTPPITDCPDPLVFSEYVDALILVARADHTTSDVVKAAMDLVPRQKVLGIVFNDCKSEM